MSIFQKNLKRMTGMCYAAMDFINFWKANSVVFNADLYDLFLYSTYNNNVFQMGKWAPKFNRKDFLKLY